MTDKKRFGVFATARIGDPSENRSLEQRYELEIFGNPDPPPNLTRCMPPFAALFGLMTTSL